MLSFKIFDKLEAYSIYYWRVRGINYDIPGKQEQHVKGPWSSRRAFATQPPTSLLQPLSDKGFSLYQNKPNPFAQETEISYNIPEDEKVTLDIIDIRGNTIKNLVHEEQPAGKHSIIFSPANLPPGLYFYRLHAGEHSESKRMILE